MCDICDGKTYQQAFEELRHRIDAHGWSLQGVEPEEHGSAWVYTIGLIENFDNPELVITGGDIHRSAGLLNALGERIARGLRIDADTVVDLDGYLVEFETVHASYLSHGLCASWDDCYRRIGTQPGPLRVLQVVLPLLEWCDHCDRKRRCLSVPGARGFGGGLNRAGGGATAASPRAGPRVARAGRCRSRLAGRRRSTHRIGTP